MTTPSYAVATVVLFTGGYGSSGKVVDGVPTGVNFLDRSRSNYAAPDKP
ncbi:hypothetical protein [Actimicrobium sp. CCI2.3]|nr:hypothetical protein [Actimicrobium sp. CCI2.3]MDY7575414.1 hypothetical protein [Actimicrobium sp. CCI2.3]MEB0021325.1 hypothetical protein [Actimicrobium sp. CCI2.3]